MNADSRVDSPKVEALLDRVRELSPAERARLVSLVLQSLDEPDAVIDLEWQAEAERRVDGMDDGSRSSTPWTEARKTLGP